MTMTTPMTQTAKPQPTASSPQTSSPAHPQAFAAETPPAYPSACANGPQPAHPVAAAPSHPSAATGEPDLVDRIFEYIFSDPAMARAVQAMANAKAAASEQPDPLHHLKTAVRAEFSGERCYITANPATERQERVAEVLRLFNGRNASEVGRRLQISRASVYRYISQARAAR